MKIPDFSIPSKDCFLTVDKNGKEIKEGDVLESSHYSLFGNEIIKRRYTVTKYQDQLVAVVKPSHLVTFYVETHCEVVNAT